MEKYLKHFLRRMRRPAEEVVGADDVAEETPAAGGGGGESEVFDEDEIPDFALTASNVYRTRHFIVRQRLAYSKSELFGGLLCSHDTYFRRTHERDLEYEDLFLDRLDPDGKRIPALMHSRKYVD